MTCFWNIKLVRLVLCVCVCVFWDQNAYQFCCWEMFLRGQNVVWSLVELHIWLHSCLYFSFLEKLFFKLSRQLFDTSRYLAYLSSTSVVFLSLSRHLLIARWINQESFYPLDSSSIHWACFAMDTYSIAEFVETF